MEVLLLIASILSYHYPAGLYRDTQRRYENMRNFNNQYDYDYHNCIIPSSHPIYEFPLALTSFFAGAILPIFSLIALDLNWFLAIVANIIIYLFIAPTLAFISTPHMTIYNKGSLKLLAIIFLVLGLAFYLIAILVK